MGGQYKQILHRTTTFTNHASSDRLQPEPSDSAPFRVRYVDGRGSFMKKLVCVVALLACGKDSKTDEPVESSRRASDEAEVAKQKAEQAAAQAVQEAKAAQDAVERLQRDADDLAKRVDGAVQDLAGAQNQADRDAAKVKLDALRTEKADLEQRIAEARAKAERAERLKGVKISKECLDNPLAKGCN
jgi:hypothetical protein